MQYISKRLSLSQSSLSKCNRAFAETSIPVIELNSWIRSNSSVAASSAVADPEPDDVSPKLPGRSTKRISKAERKLLLESFVNRYKAMNSGKYPTAHEAQKEVGGGYYSVRKIIQELEYESRMSSANLTRQSERVEVKKNNEQFKVKNSMEDVERSEEVQLSGQETIVTELPLNDDVSGVSFAKEKEVSEIINLSCKEDPVSTGEITYEENVKYAHIDSNNVASLTAGKKPFKEDASVLDKNNSSYNDLISSENVDKADEIIWNTDFSYKKPEVLPLTPEISENLKEKTVSVNDHHIESSKREVPVRSDFCNEEPKIVPPTPDILEDMRENIMTIDNRQVESSKMEGPVMSDFSNEELKFVAPAMKILEDMEEKTTIDDHQFELPKTEEPVRGMTDKESPKKSFSWNLKSIADGIVNFWRKL